MWPGYLQLYFQKCSFWKCKSQKCKNKKNPQKSLDGPKNHLWEDLKMTLLKVYFFKSVEIESVVVSAHPHCIQIGLFVYTVSEQCYLLFNEWYILLGLKWIK